MFIIEKKGVKKVNFGVILFIGIYTLLTVSGLVFFKIGTNKQFDVALMQGNFNLNINLLAVLGLVFYVISFLMYMFLVSKFDLSYIVPISTGLVYLATFVCSITIFKELITVQHIFGAVLVLAGIILINIKS